MLKPFVGENVFADIPLVCYGLADDNGPLRRYPACVLWPATCAMLKPFVGENVFHCVLWPANYDTPPGMAPTVCMGD